MLHWAVAVGDTVEVNQILCEIETAKSAVELPSPVAGVIEALHVDEGAAVEVGTVIVTFRVGGSAATGKTPDPQVPSTEPLRAVPALQPTPPQPAKTPPMPKHCCSQKLRPHPEVKVLVGTGPSKLAARRRHLRPRSEMPHLVSPVTETRQCRSMAFAKPLRQR